MNRLDKLTEVKPAQIRGALPDKNLWEPKSFRQSVAQFHQPLYRYYAVHTGDLTQAQALTGETFAVVYRTAAPLQTSNFPSWLFGIAWDVLNVHVGRQEGQTQASADINELAQMLNALRSLAFYRRETLYLRCFAELSVKDIAVMMDKTETHVKALIYQGVAEVGSRMTGTEYVAPSRKQLLSLASTYHIYLSEFLAGGTPQQSIPLALAEATAQLKLLRDVVSMAPEARTHLHSQIEELITPADSSTTPL